jgi:hypothetical protein
MAQGKWSGNQNHRAQVGSLRAMVLWFGGCEVHGASLLILTTVNEKVGPHEGLKTHPGLANFTLCWAQDIDSQFKILERHL